MSFDFFSHIVNHDNWTILELFSKNNPKKSCGVLISHYNGKSYSPLIFGANYNEIQKGNIYNFLLLQIIKKSYSNEVKNVFLGITNSSGKRKIGAKQIKTKAFVQVNDHYNDSVIETYAKQLNVINK